MLIPSPILLMLTRSLKANPPSHYHNADPLPPLLMLTHSLKANPPSHYHNADPLYHSPNANPLSIVTPLSLNANPLSLF